METTQDQALTGYLAGLGIKANIREDYNDYAPAIWEKSNHYRINLAYQGRRMAFWFYQGKGITRKPSLADVIYCLASDRNYAHYTREEFGEELGWNKDTSATYRHLTNLNQRYERVIGNEAILNKIAELAGEM